MLKRKYGDRLKWKRVTERIYNQMYFDNEDFKGYVTLLQILKVSEPLSVTYNDKKICIADDRYMWLQHFPTDEHYAITTMFNASGEIVQWYIDICFRIGVSNNVPWIDDLFLDVIVLPNGEFILKDIDELKEALESEQIDNRLYEFAWNEAKNIITAIEKESFTPLSLSKQHKDALLENMNNGYFIKKRI